MKVSIVVKGGEGKTCGRGEGRGGGGDKGRGGVLGGQVREE